MASQFIFFFFLLIATCGFASDGRLEINQTCAEQTGCFPGDTPGFPVTIDGSGSFVLTSSLFVLDANTTVIDLTAEADGSTIDLNGFSIVGVTVCSPISDTCSPSGTGVGIRAASGTVEIRIMNGTVSGMGSHGILLQNRDYVKNVTAINNGGPGIEVGARSSVIDSQAILNGGSGIVVDEFTSPGPLVNAGESLLRGNLATANGVADQEALDIQGSRSGGGNVCGDQTCSLRDARRYYLTAAGYSGAQASGACTGGYHMASLWELFDPSNLQYAIIPQRGVATFSVQGDQGSGPPSAADGYGWIRTGIEDSLVAAAAGQTNCDGYTDDSKANLGSAMRPSPAWVTQTNTFSAWEVKVEDCNALIPVWCVED